MLNKNVQHACLNLVQFGKLAFNNSGDQVKAARKSG
jgi:hypothetical protein